MKLTIIGVYVYGCVMFSSLFLKHNEVYFLFFQKSKQLLLVFSMSFSCQLQQISIKS